MVPVVLDSDTGNSSIRDLQPVNMLQRDVKNKCNHHAYHAGMRDNEYMPVAI